MARVGLVLGAGGFVGQAYHAGVLAALEEVWKTCMPGPLVRAAS